MLNENKGLLHQRLGESGMTVTQLAKVSGVHRNTLNTMMNGKKVNLQAKSIKKIALALKLPSNDILKIFHPYCKIG